MSVVCGTIQLYFWSCCHPFVVTLHNVILRWHNFNHSMPLRILQKSPCLINALIFWLACSSYLSIERARTNKKASGVLSRLWFSTRYSRVIVIYDRVFICRSKTLIPAHGFLRYLDWFVEEICGCNYLFQMGFTRKCLLNGYFLCKPLWNRIGSNLRPVRWISD